MCWVLERHDSSWMAIFMAGSWRSGDTELSMLCHHAVDLLQTKEIACRAWDASNNTQPNTFTWNIMGMMNNCIYRVKVCTRPPLQKQVNNGIC